MGLCFHIRGHGGVRSVHALPGFQRDKDELFEVQALRLGVYRAAELCGDIQKQALFQGGQEHLCLYRRCCAPFFADSLFYCNHDTAVPQGRAVRVQVYLLSAGHRLGRRAVGRVAVAVRFFPGRPFQSGHDLFRPARAELALLQQDVHALAHAYGAAVGTGDEYNHLHSGASEH